MMQGVSSLLRWEDSTCSGAGDGSATSGHTPIRHAFARPHQQRANCTEGQKRVRRWMERGCTWWGVPHARVRSRPLGVATATAWPKSCPLSSSVRASTNQTCNNRPPHTKHSGQFSKKLHRATETSHSIDVGVVMHSSSQK